MTYIHTTQTAQPARRSWFARLADLRNVWRQRKSLSRLDEAALKDIGITLDQARNEARRAVWDAPDRWYF